MTLDEMKALFEEAALASSEEEIKEIADNIHDDVMAARGLKDLDLEGIQPLDQLTENTIQLREDVALDGFDRDQALDYAKEREYGYFKIKRVID